MSQLFPPCRDETAAFLLSTLESCLMELVIDPGFASQLALLSERELAQLEEKVLLEGVQSPLIYWVNEAGEKVLVDGHNRYAVCQRHGLGFETKGITEIAPGVVTREDVEEWIDKNQIARRNLTPGQFEMVIGRVYNRRKSGHGGVRWDGPTSKNTGENEQEGSSCQSGNLMPETGSEAASKSKPKADPRRKAEEVASEMGVNQRKVIRSAKRAEVADILKDAGEADAANFVVNMPQKDITDDWNRAHELHKDGRAIRMAIVEMILGRYERHLKAEEKKAAGPPAPKAEKEEAPVKAKDLQKDVKPIKKQEAGELLLRLRHSDPKVIQYLYAALSKEEAIVGTPLNGKELADLSNRIKAAQQSVKVSLFNSVVRDPGDTLVTHVKRWCRETFGEKTKIATWPTLQEVEAYAVGRIKDEKKAKAIAASFWNHYESTGWKQGKEHPQPIKSWVATFNKHQKRMIEWHERDLKEERAKNPAAINNDDFAMPRGFNKPGEKRDIPRRPANVGG
jgi:hypothetical protein